MKLPKKGGDKMKLFSKKAVISLAVISLLAVPCLSFAAVDFGLSAGVNTGLTSNDIRDTIASIINVALGLLGIVCVVIVIAGGFLWMTAAGNEEKVEKAKKLLGAGVIGLVIVLCAYAIATFVLTRLGTATGTNP